LEKIPILELGCHLKIKSSPKRQQQEKNSQQRKVIAISKLEGPRRRECLLEPRGGSIKWKLELSSVRPMGAGAIQKMQPKTEKHARNMTSLSTLP
jgi:hypothetical protein